MKPIYWLGDTRKNLRTMPANVQDTFGYALYLAQVGEKHHAAKPLRGFSGAGVLEIVDSCSSGTYRAVYTVEFEEAVYVLHVFQKKSTSGISTPKQEIALIEHRLKQALEKHKEV